MEFDNAFEIPLPPDKAWPLLMDIERIAPCVPGAELTEKIDDQTFKGKIGVKLGPVALSFNGTAKLENIDTTAHSAQIKASGSDVKGRGAANAVTGFRIEPAGSGSKVLLHTNLNLSGSVAQYGRGAGMIQEVAAQIIKQFAGTLHKQILASQATAPAAAPATPVGNASPSAAAASAGTPIPPQPAFTPPPTFTPPEVKPISGFSLMAKVLWNLIRGLFSSKS